MLLPHALPFSFPCEDGMQGWKGKIWFPLTFASRSGSMGLVCAVGWKKEVADSG